jgi:hypothetical protein
MRRVLTALLFAGCAAAAFAQADEPKPIQDNSFLAEEAYNQEYGVVQHISNFRRTWPSGNWYYSFTQEWPVDAAPRHQLSYTLTAVDPDGTVGAGFGDVLLNYRYQLIGNGDTRIAFAPRFTLVVPTGDWRLGRGAGGVGYQFMLPLSVVTTKHLVTHWDLGATLTPNARDPLGEHAATHEYTAAQSFVWLASPRVNFLLETVFDSGEAVVGRGQTQRQNTLVMSPGVRWAYNFKNGLQIVPGIAAPIGVGPSAGDNSIFIYLSFEHPYRKLKKR